MATPLKKWWNLPRTHGAGIWHNFRRAWGGALAKAFPGRKPRFQ